MNTYNWYQTLNKPFFAPPAAAFSIAWGILYPIIFISFGYVFYLAIVKKIKFPVTVPFIVNLISNFLFVPIQFGLKNNLLATLDILIVLTSLIACIFKIKKYSKLVALAQIPYLLWVTFATILQISILLLN